MIKEVELNKKILDVIYSWDDVVHAVYMLREIAKIKDEWNKTEGFEDYRELDENMNDVSRYNKIANDIETLLVKGIDE
jgi:hypothetical protein